MPEPRPIRTVLEACREAGLPPVAHDIGRKGKTKQPEQINKIQELNKVTTDKFEYV